MSFLLSLLAFAFMPVSEVSATMADTSASYQTAFLYFLPDYQSKELVRSSEYCSNNGYTYNRNTCPAPRILKEKCPTGNYYKTCFCAGSPTCSGSLSSANPYSNTTGTSHSSCIDCPGNTRYNWTCTRKCAASVSSKPSNSTYTTCSDCSGTYNIGWNCNSGYYKSGNSCVCATSCRDKVSSKPSNSSYTTTSCTACGVTTTIKTGWSCNAGYHQSGNSCEEDCTPLSNETNCSYGTYSCSDGCGGTRKCCKVCDPEDRDCQCPGYVYCGTTKTGSGASCTAGSKTFYETCLVQETCMEQPYGNSYIAAPNSYIGRNYTYVRPYCTTQTGIVLNLYVGCTATIDGISGPCSGKKQCTSGYQNDGSTEPCICDHTKFFDVCTDTCNLDGLVANNGVCNAYSGNPKGQYFVKEKCKTSSGSTVNYFTPCNLTDCLGNRGPCYGKKECTSGTIAVDPCYCGNATFGSSCVVKCPYEQQESDCKAGQTFTFHCSDNDGNRWGECK